MSPDGLYRFYVDRQDIADNMLKKWQGERPGHPIEVSKNLVDLATDLYQQAIVDEEEEEEQQDSGEENESIIDVDKALTSGEYKKYL